MNNKSAIRCFSLFILFCSCSNLDNYFLFLGNYTKTDQYDFSEKFASLTSEQWKLITVPTPVVSTDGLWIRGDTIVDTSLNGIVCLFFNGNDGSLELSSDFGLLIRTLGIDFFSIDLRGYGRSAKSFSTTENSCYEDGVTAIEYLCDTLGYPLEKIILIGFSMGGGIAVELAVRYKLKGIVLMSTFTNMDNMVEAIGGGYNIPGNWVMNSKFDNISKISNIHMPVFITCGSKDMLIDPENSKQLYSKANFPKEFHIIEGASHPNFPVVSFEAYKKKLKEFLLKYCR